MQPHPNIHQQDTHHRHPSPSPIITEAFHDAIRLPDTPITPSTSNPFPEPQSQLHSHPHSHSSDIPWKLILPILFLRFGDAMSYEVIFPIVTDMITSFQVAPDKIGLWAGMAEGALMITEALCATTWARLADKYGRKPCLMAGFMFAISGTGLVGFSTSVGKLILWRAILGMNPCGVLNKIIASEISNPVNRDKIFAIFSPAFATGTMIGTLIGGELAHPYGRLPHLLGGSSEFWKEWPYALPCVVTTGVAIIALVVSYVYLIETRPPSHSLQIHTTAEKNDHHRAISAALKVPHFALITIVFLSYQLTSFSIEGIFAVYTYTDVDLGGLGLSVDIIGFLYAAAAFSYIITAPLLLPIMKKRFGAVKSLQIAFLAWVGVTMTLPLSQWTAIHWRGGMWLVLICQTGLRCVGGFGWPMCDILTMSAFDDYPELLATGSAISLIAGAFGRAFGPAISGWIYSLSTQHPVGSLGRQSSWLAMLAISLPPFFLSRLLPSEKKYKEGYETVPLDEESDVDVGGESEEVV
ncbi:hypothetical protein M231_04943 [Tremella mesenterica]|uniref:Major facilitator superfamily (MFS) profile domain-containing protein n=1 Tax=Tremella mesenterica TaxID=5217 RepID=A0A4V1M3R5_TREME|nr:hypothetical protein M231_04943 [Tremella mesenterica]